MSNGRENEKTISLLGNQKNKYPDNYAPEMLETFINKHPDNDYFVKFNCPEFTSLCPITGQPDFSAIFKLPSLNGSRSIRSSFLFLVPSGKIQTEMPLFTWAMPSKMVFNPSFMSVRFKNRQWTFFIQLLSSGHFSISFFAT